MPKPKHKKNAFIDKKASTSFHLVHRSQKDPLAADDTVGQMVLKSMLPKELRTEAKEEERKFGVFYEDNYNYMQHLKDRNVVEHDWSEADRFLLEAKDAKPGVDQPKLQLPSTVFGTEAEEEEVGLLNKAARTTGLDLSLDPDIVAAMDDAKNVGDGDSEDEMDDDFITQLMGEGDGSCEEDDGSYEEGSDMDSDFGGGRSEDEEDDEVPSLQSWSGEETATKFTNYSMSSSCIRRNAQLTLQDDKFEKFFDQYSDGEEGALEGEDIEGTLDEEGQRMENLLAAHKEEKRTERQQLEREREVVRRVLEQEDGEEMEEIVLPADAVAKREQWDAETILTTYSTLYNHPKLISEPKKLGPIQLSSKTGIPKDTLGRGLTSAALKQLDLENNANDDEDDLKSRMTECSMRPKHETKEEKKARKMEVKAVRRERREEKKANILAFKSEKIRQEKISLNVKNNVQGIKIC